MRHRWRSALKCQRTPSSNCCLPPVVALVGVHATGARAGVCREDVFGAFGVRLQDEYRNVVLKGLVIVVFVLDRRIHLYR